MAFLHISLALLLTSIGVNAVLFTLENRCDKTIWSGIQASIGQPQLMEGGLELRPQQSRNVTAPKGWSGRFWGRTGCNFNVYGEGTCTTGDCGTGLHCNGASGEPPASLAEFTLDSPLDFYDVSLLDGFNLPISIFPYGGSGICPSIRCDTNLNLYCPPNLQVRGDGGEVVACKSACTAFQTPEYCCTGPYQNPNRCKPSRYTQYFKRACPTSYTYAYDDPATTYTCRETNYLIIFC
ncbi:thaumatin-like protein [Cynara cardunculus var. scolymus]|uniref:Thaumatin n=1 Tax=Cynara cardunculus var. scolymus TaxID=59895 RepID=A0A103XEN5_CYNCS|nr:thaumatin-like protein [Cynara cardunculus var. scolymus]KVH89353.1 Thaumatin [Cynara cardunculus var. scolymus]